MCRRGALDNTCAFRRAFQYVFRQMIGADYTVVGKKTRALENVPHFTNIARPWISLKFCNRLASGHELVASRAAVGITYLVDSLENRIDEKRDVTTPLAQ